MLLKLRLLLLMISVSKLAINGSTMVYVCPLGSAQFFMLLVYGNFVWVGDGGLW